MSDITAYNELADLLKLRIGKLLRSDEDYKEMYQRRLTRLDAIPSATARSMSTLAERAISITRSSHEFADELAAEIREIEALTTEDDAARVERLLAWDDRVMRAHAPGAPEAVDRLRNEAYNFMRWRVSPVAATDTHSVQVAIEDHFREEREHDRMLIATIVNRLLMAQQSRSTQLALLPSLARLGQIYRGLLYVGVIDTKGSRLERQELGKLLGAAATEIAGHFLPGLGLVKVLAEFLNHSEPDRPLPSVEGARAVEDYLAKYTAAMDEWITAAKTIVEFSRQTREALDSV